MARTFNGTTQYLESSTVPVSSWPITMACWCKCDAKTQNNYWPFSLGYTGSAQTLDYIGIALNTVAAGDPVRWQPSNNGAAIANTSTGWSTNTWHHVCGRTSGNTNHAVFLDGGSKGTSSTSVVFPTLNATTAGGLVHYSGGTQRAYFDGSVIWATIWNVALTDEEIARLGKGEFPYKIRPQNIVFFDPMDERHGRQVEDWGGNVILTEYNSPGWSKSVPKNIREPWNLSPEEFTNTLSFQHSTWSSRNSTSVWRPRSVILIPEIAAAGGGDTYPASLIRLTSL